MYVYFNIYGMPTIKYANICDYQMANGEKKMIEKIQPLAGLVSIFNGHFNEVSISTALKV